MRHSKCWCAWLFDWVPPHEKPHFQGQSPQAIWCRALVGEKLRVHAVVDWHPVRTRAVGVQVTPEAHWCPLCVCVCPVSVGRLGVSPPSYRGIIVKHSVCVTAWGEECMVRGRDDQPFVWGGCGFSAVSFSGACVSLSHNLPPFSMQYIVIGCILLRHCL
jgi:hypothetical protein